MKRQSQNFILDNSKLLISNEDAIEQIEHIYLDEKREWVNKIMLIENGKLIKIFKRI